MAPFLALRDGNVECDLYTNASNKLGTILPPKRIM